MADPVFIPAARAADLAADTATAVTIEGRSILLVASEGGIFAVADRCSHADEPLACGRVKRGWIACPAHGARFDLETGEALGPPATEPIETFAVRIEDGTVMVGIQGAA